ncbi:MAG: hypothetical protein EDM74_02315 [Armatimonadetes bacterium]|nr:MAG: hypothetical protein EDM74_02315 [Armatimonadota bacterium]
MKVWLFETNLLWSERLKSGLLALGYEVEQVSPAAVPDGAADLVIASLTEIAKAPPDFVQLLKSRSAKIIGHAGHVETDLFQLGSDLGFDAVFPNGKVANRLEAVLKEIG